METNKPNPMKTLHQRMVRLVGLGSLITLALTYSVPQAFAGQGIDYWRNAGQIKTIKQADALPPRAEMMLVCGGCKTVKVSGKKSDWPNGKGPRNWVEVGSKHDCDHCGGKITVVNGKTKDEMQHNCSKCGNGAAFCCAITPSKDKQ